MKDLNNYYKKQLNYEYNRRLHWRRLFGAGIRVPAAAGRGKDIRVDNGQTPEMAR